MPKKNEKPKARRVTTYSTIPVVPPKVNPTQRRWIEQNGGRAAFAAKLTGVIRDWTHQQIVEHAAESAEKERAAAEESKRQREVERARKRAEKDRKQAEESAAVLAEIEAGLGAADRFIRKELREVAREGRNKAEAGMVHGDGS